MIDTLQKFGTAFQAKTIYVLTNDKKFLDQTHDIIDSKFFDAEAHQWIVDKTLWYYGSYREVPSLAVFKAELSKESDDAFKKQVIASLKEAFESEGSDLTYVKDEFLDFCKNQALKAAILKSADLLKRGDFDKIKSEISHAMMVGQEHDFGHDWKIDLDDRLANSARNTLPTGWDVVDGLTDGGLAGGELGVIIAPSGIGKSWFLCRIGLAAIKAGKRVVHYSFELNQNYVGLRYDTLLTGIEPKNIRLNKSVVEQAIQQIKGDLAIKYYPVRTINTNTLMADIQRRINVGMKPDLIIIDYADLMRPTERGDSRYQDLGITYEDIRGMLGELDIPGWTASQSQRSSLNDDIIEADKVAESYAKIMTADLIMSVSRKLEDKVANTGRAHLIKNRFGQDGITMPCEINFTKGLIEIYDENSPKGSLLKKQMKAGESEVKKMLHDKWKAHQTNIYSEEEYDDLG
jgi:replicative DNA helicase